MAGIFGLIRNVRIYGAAALVVVGANAVLVQTTADPEAVNILRREIASEYTRFAQQQAKNLDATTQIAVDPPEIRFRSVSVRGFGKETHFRIEIEPSERHPPGTPLKRYYQLEYSLITGWVRPPRRRTNGIGYYTAGLL